MKRNYLPGERIALVAMSEKGKKFACVGVVVGVGEKGGPYVKIDSPAFRNPPQLELIEELIDASGDEPRYLGEISGAVLIPNFLWVSP